MLSFRPRSGGVHRSLSCSGARPRTVAARRQPWQWTASSSGARLRSVQMKPNHRATRPTIRRTQAECSIDSWDQPPSAAAVSIIRIAEVFAQEDFLRVDSREQGRHQQRCQNQTAPRSECESPSDRVDEQSEIAGVADDPVDTACDKRMPRLNGNQSAKPTPEYRIPAKCAMLHRRRRVQRQPSELGVHRASKIPSDPCRPGDKP